MEAEKGKKDRLLPMVSEFAALLQEVPKDERIGTDFNPIARIKQTERMLSSTVSKQIADIGEKANVVVGETRETLTKRQGSRNLVTRPPMTCAGHSVSGGP